jgi:hypothetical protein
MYFVNGLAVNGDCPSGLKLQKPAQQRPPCLYLLSYYVPMRKVYFFGAAYWSAPHKVVFQEIEDKQFQAVPRPRLYMRCEENALAASGQIMSDCSAPIADEQLVFHHAAPCRHVWC